MNVFTTLPSIHFQMQGGEKVIFGNSQYKSRKVETDLVWLTTIGFSN